MVSSSPFKSSVSHKQSTIKRHCHSNYQHYPPRVEAGSISKAAIAEAEQQREVHTQAILKLKTYKPLDQKRKEKLQMINMND